MVMFARPYPPSTTHSIGGEGQRPWCYVGDKCAAAKGGGQRRRGSFGKLYAECVAVPDKVRHGIIK